MNKVMEDTKVIVTINRATDKINKYLEKSGIAPMKRLARIDRKEEYLMQLKEKIDQIEDESKKIAVKIYKSISKTNTAPSE